MLLASLRDRVLTRIKRGGTSFTPTEVDYAIQLALQELDLDAYFSLVYTDLATMTINNPEVSIAALLPDVATAVNTGIRPERVMRAELAFNDRGTWSAASVSYAVNDLVTGDGSPDSYFYECVEAHTSSASNQPGDSGGDDYWSRRQWKHGDVLDLLNRDAVARMLGDRPIFRPYLPLDFVFAPDPAGSPGKPRIGAFLTQDIFLVWPPPDVAYRLRFLIQYPVTEWEPGESDAVTLEVPDNILVPAIDGMCYYLDDTHKLAAFWKQRFEQHVRKAQGMTIVDAGAPTRDRSAYLDHTDGVIGGWMGEGFLYGR